MDFLLGDVIFELLGWILNSLLTCVCWLGTDTYIAPEAQPKTKRPIDTPPPRKIVWSEGVEERSRRGQQAPRRR